MEISPEEVRRIARLARLRLSEEEVRLYRSQFSRILEFVAELEFLDAPAREAEEPGDGPEQALRADEPRPFPEPQRLVSLAPQSEGGYYKVPKVIG